MTNSYDFLATNTGATARYEAWFGTYSTTNFDSVQSAFSIMIENAFSDYYYDCTNCGDTDIAAYVLSNAYVKSAICRKRSS